MECCCFFQEILDASKNVKTPEMTVFFEGGLRIKKYTKDMIGKDHGKFKEEFERLASEEKSQIMKLKQLIEYQTISIYTLQTRIVYKSDEEEFGDDNIFGDAANDTFDPIVLIIYIDTQAKATHEIFDLLVRRIKELADQPKYKRGGVLNVEKKAFDNGQIHVKFFTQNNDN